MVLLNIILLFERLYCLDFYHQALELHCNEVGAPTELRMGVVGIATS